MRSWVDSYPTGWVNNSLVELPCELLRSEYCGCLTRPVVAQPICVVFIPYYSPCFKIYILIFIYFCFSVSRRCSTRDAWGYAGDAWRPPRCPGHGSQGPWARSRSVSSTESGSLETRAPDVVGGLLCSCPGSDVGGDVFTGQHDPRRTSQLPPCST